MEFDEYPCGCYTDGARDTYCALHWEPLRLWMEAPTFDTDCDCGHSDLARSWHGASCPSGESLGDLMSRLGLERSPLS